MKLTHTPLQHSIIESVWVNLFVLLPLLKLQTHTHTHTHEDEAYATRQWQTNTDCQIQTDDAYKYLVWFQSRLQFWECVVEIVQIKLNKGQCVCGHWTSVSPSGNEWLLSQLQILMMMCVCVCVFLQRWWFPGSGVPPRHQHTAEPSWSWRPSAGHWL